MQQKLILVKCLILFFWSANFYSRSNYLLAVLVPTDDRPASWFVKELRKQQVYGFFSSRLRFNPIKMQWFEKLVDQKLVRFPFYSDSAVYGLDNLERLFALDGYGRNIEAGYNSQNGLFNFTLASLKSDLNIRNVTFRHKKCRSFGHLPGGHGMCWLNAVVNAARFFARGNLPLLGDDQFQELVHILFDYQLQKVSENLSVVSRQEQMSQIMIKAFIEDDGSYSEGLLFVLFNRMEQLKNMCKSIKDPLVKEYLEALMIMVCQVVQNPLVRTTSQFDKKRPSVISICDVELFFTEVASPVLRISAIQGLSRETWLNFVSRRQSLIAFVSVDHSYSLLHDPFAHFCQQHGRRESSHVVAVEFEISMFGTLHANIFDSASSDVLDLPSIVPGIFMAICGLAKKAKIDGSGLIKEAALKEHTGELLAYSLLKDKYLPPSDPLFGELDQIFFNKFPSNDRPEGMSFESLSDPICKYNCLLDCLKEAWEIFPNQVRLLYAEEFFENKFGAKVFWSQKLVDPIIGIFGLGIGLTKEQVGFIDKVYSWQEDLRLASSLQIAFCVFEGRLIHSLQPLFCAKARELPPVNFFLRHLADEDCSDCKNIYAQLLELARERDRKRFADFIAMSYL